MPDARPPRPLTRAEVREVDRRATLELGMPGVLLMENAALGLLATVERVLRELGASSGAGVGVVCGRGNNGGDGLALARHLDLRGWRPRVAFTGRVTEADATTEVGTHLRVLARSGFTVEEVRDGPALTALLAGWSDVVLLVDGLYGTGLSTPLTEPGLGLVRALDADPRPKVAIDLPSGLDADTGRSLGAVVRCVRTATFVHEKVGLAAARDLTGPVDVVSIGVPRRAWEFVR